MNNEGIAEVVAEYKYEPSHERADIPSSKFPVVFWGKDGVGKGIHRIRKFVTEGKAKKGYSIFIDEGGYFKHREPHPGSEWINWGNGIWILFSTYPD